MGWRPPLVVERYIGPDPSHKHKHTQQSRLAGLKVMMALTMKSLTVANLMRSVRAARGEKRWRHWRHEEITCTRKQSRVLKFEEFETLKSVCTEQENFDGLTVSDVKQTGS